MGGEHTKTKLNDTRKCAPAQDGSTEYRDRKARLLTRWSTTPNEEVTMGVGQQNSYETRLVEKASQPAGQESLPRFARQQRRLGSGQNGRFVVCVPMCSIQVTKFSGHFRGKERSLPCAGLAGKERRGAITCASTAGFVVLTFVCLEHRIDSLFSLSQSLNTSAVRYSLPASTPQRPRV